MTNTEPSIEEFRRNATNINELREVLYGNPVMLHAMRAVRGSAPDRNAAITGDAIRDAGQFARSVGFHECLDRFFQLAAPIDEEEASDIQDSLPTEEELERMLEEQET